MKITVGVWKKDIQHYKGKIPKNDILFSYETKRFVAKGFRKRMEKFISMVKEKLNNVADDENIIIGIDLKYGEETRTGGCTVSGATLNATRVSIIHMAVAQLIRQIKETLEELRKVK